MSFQQGLSGLNAASRNLDVIGNNVANANTVGAKTSRAEFADVYASSLSGAIANGAGIGVTVSEIAQQFTQGDIATTNNPLDVAINGAGFFRMSNQGSIEYTRNGQFKLDKEGYVVNSQGARLTGYRADDTGLISQGAAADMRLSTVDITPKVSSEGRIAANLDARATVATLPFNVSDPRTFNGATTYTLFDSLGREHSLAMYFRKTGANAWEVNAAADGTALTTNPVGNLTFSSAGLNTTGSPMTVTLPVGADAGGSQVFVIEASSVTQFGSNFGVTEMNQNGYTAGRLTGFSVADDGVIQGRYSNGQSRPQGQVALANFVNPQGLQSLGGNAWASSASSGQALVGSPATGNLGVLQSGAVENSNVDLTGELVNMITAQRFYQANAQTIKTQDQVLQTLVNLR
jgi:flagellar hook protein FlgE